MRARSNNTSRLIQVQWQNLVSSNETDDHNQQTNKQIVIAFAFYEENKTMQIKITSNIKQNE